MGVLALLGNPDQLDKLREQPVVIKSAVEEFLRYGGPVETATERFPVCDISVAGVTIPPGDLVLAVLASANRDDSRFENPDTLDIMREPNPHVAFGYGTHYCLGAALARSEAQVAIASLLRRMQNLRLGTPEAWPRFARVEELARKFCRNRSGESSPALSSTK